MKTEADPGSCKKHAFSVIQTNTSYLVFEVGVQIVFPVICGHAVVGKHLDVGLHKAHKHLCTLHSRHKDVSCIGLQTHCGLYILH